MEQCAKNTKVLVLGYGVVGRCLAKVLNALQFSVAVADSCYILDNSGLQFYQADLQHELDFNDILKDFKPHIVISALPYFLNARIAELCSINSVSYIDLGGSVPISEAINKLDFSNSLCLTDLGLAPGLINIIAEGLYEQNKDKNVDTIGMYVGGIPISLDIGGPLSYVCSWSLEGLINQYTHKCEVLENGEIVNKDALDGLEYLTGYYDYEYYEAFYTSGGAAHSLKSLQAKGLKNCAYKTLRYEGHRKLIKWLLSSGLDKESLYKLLNNVPEEDKNKKNSKVVLICNLLKTENGKEKIVKQHIDQIRATTNFSSMQRATALPVVAIIQLISCCLITKQGCLGYSDIPYEPFMQNLKALLDNPSF